MAFTAYISLRGSEEAQKAVLDIKPTATNVRYLCVAIGKRLSQFARDNVTQQMAQPTEHSVTLPGSMKTQALQRLRSSIGYDAGATSVRVFANDVIAAQRNFGGPIEAGDKMLTIPVAPEAYGHRALDFPNLVALSVGPNHQGVLAAIGGKGFRADLKSGQKGLEKLRSGAMDAGRFTIMYLLLSRVVTKPHPFWPTIEEALTRAVLDVREWINRQRAQGGTA